ncbi:MAG TPA: sensor histidine kinase [Thermomicrobiales bacterium]|nr:sensor histidine kinase [Thermomicrobiales bacterium]
MRSAIRALLQPLRRLSFAQRFMLASLVILVTGMFGVGTWVANRIESGVVHRTSATTALYVDSVVAPHLQGMATGSTISAAEQNELNHLFADTPLGEQIAAFKVWGPGGLVVYSTEPSVIGKVYPVHPRLRESWDGAVTAGISDLDAEENEMERQSQARLLEIYTPVRLRGTNDVIAVAEFYQVTDALDRELTSATRTSWLIVGGATLVMYLLLAGFVQRASNTIVRQRGELESQVDRLTDLLQQNEQLHDRVRRAAARTTALNERFLRRFSSELHDGPAQDLSLALLELDNVIVSCGGLPDAASCTRQLDTIQQSVRRALQEIRTTSAGLMLPQLSKLPLADTVRHAVRAHERRSGTQVSVVLGPLPDDAPVATKIAIYRVIQESLTNGVRHAGGIQQEVRVGVDDASFTVQVIDHGHGFDATRVLASDEHMGLVGMRERVESLGGMLVIESAPGRGTTVIAHLPVETVPAEDRAEELVHA